MRERKKKLGGSWKVDGQVAKNIADLRKLKPMQAEGKVKN